MNGLFQLKCGIIKHLFNIRTESNQLKSLLESNVFKKIVEFLQTLWTLYLKELHLEHLRPMVTSLHDMNGQVYYPLCKAMHVLPGLPQNVIIAFV